MSYSCASCGKELNKVLSSNSEASKSFLRREGYDGAEWIETYELIKRFNFPHLPEPYLTEQSRRFPWVKPYLVVKFCLCLKCTPKDFNFIGEK